MKTTNILTLLLIFILSSACSKTEKEITHFEGNITYIYTGKGDSTGVNLIRTYLPNMVIVFFKDDKFKMQEIGGLMEANIVGDRKTKKFYHMEENSNNYYELKTTSMDDMKDEVKKMLPLNFKTELEDTKETETICGYECKKYKITASGFIKPNIDAYVWITEKINLPKTRYDFQGRGSRTITPYPLQIPIEKGAILRYQAFEDNTLFTVEANAIEENELSENLFNILENYVELKDSTKSPTK